MAATKDFFSIINNHLFTNPKKDINHIMLDSIILDYAPKKDFQIIYGMFNNNYDNNYYDIINDNYSDSHIFQFFKKSSEHQKKENPIKDQTLSDKRLKGLYEYNKPKYQFNFKVLMQHSEIQTQCKELISGLKLPKAVQKTINNEKVLQARISAIIVSAESDHRTFVWQTRVKFKVVPKFIIAPRKLRNANYKTAKRNLMTDDEIIQELASSSSHHEIFSKIKKMPRYEKFCLAARAYWAFLAAGKISKKVVSDFDSKALADNPIHTFDLDQFSLDYRSFVSEQHFSLSAMDLAKDLQSENGVKLRSAQTYQTIKQHQTMIWAMSNRHRRKYFEQVLKRKKRTINIVEDLFLNVVDLTQDSPKNAYTFLVHTTSGNIKNLETLFGGEKSFIHDTPFFSCSLIDRNTPAPHMNHQDKVIFNFSIILDVAEDAVLKAFPCDAWSPMLSYSDDKEYLSREYLKQIKNDTDHFLGKEFFIRAYSMQPETAVSSSLSTLDTALIYANMQDLIVPDLGVYGKMPNFMPQQLLQATKNIYNEVIVAGKSQNKILGICVEESNLKAFQEQFPALDKENKEKAIQSLQFLAKAKIPIILIKTNPNFKLQKQDTRDHFKELLNRREQVISELSKLYLEQSCLLFDTEENPGKQLCYKHVTMEIDSNLHTLQEIDDESESLTKAHKHKKVRV